MKAPMSHLEVVLNHCNRLVVSWSKNGEDQQPQCNALDRMGIY